MNNVSANSENFAAKQAELAKKTRVIAITGGKGGIGKTNVTINLGAALSEQGKEVLLLDADLGLGNVDVALGLKPEFNLSHVFSGEKSLDDVLVTGPGGVKIIPASSGVQSMSELSNESHAALVQAFDSLETTPDVLMVDTAAGISNMVLNFVRAVQEVVVVVCNEPASIADAYALIKVLNQEKGIQSFRVLVNMVESNEEGRRLFGKLAEVTEHFLDITLQYLGCVPFDERLRKAIKQQRSVVDAFPRSKSTFAFRNIAASIGKWPMPSGASGRVEFFLEKLLNQE